MVPVTASAVTLWRNLITSITTTLTQKRQPRFWNFWRLSTYRRLYKQLTKRSKRRLIRYSLLTANLLVMAVVVGFVLQGHQGSAAYSPSRNLSVLGESSKTANPLDQSSSADIAVYIAKATNISETPAVANNADTVNAQKLVSSANQSVITKPQVITDGLKSRKDIQSYTPQAGDSVASIAAKFGVTSDTVRWSNGLTGDAVTAGKPLVISPVNGLVYQVKAGDTIDSLTTKYHANRDLLVAINDAESGNLPAAGQNIVIPGGSPAIATAAPARTTVASVTASAGFAWGGGGAVYSGNGYDYGYCTWWAATRRAQIGRPIPSNLGNASTWKVLAERAGLGVGNAPAAGAVIWFPPRDYYGHVGFVESVNGDGSVNVSEMNVAGWGRVSNRTIPASEASAYSYIY